MSVRAGWNYARFKRDNPASAMGHNFNKEFGIPGATEVPDGGFSQINVETPGLGLVPSPCPRGG